MIRWSKPKRLDAKEGDFDPAQEPVKSAFVAGLFMGIIFFISMERRSKT